MIVARLSGAFGAVVRDVDLREPLSGVAMRTMAGALYRHRFLLVPDQDLTPAQYAHFGAAWGTPISFFVPRHRDREFPEIIRITNSPATPPESRDGAMHWHSDSSYEAEPAAVTMLYALEMPVTGNATRFADTAGAYDALPDGLKERIEGLVVVHDPRAARSTRRRRSGGVARRSGCPWFGIRSWRFTLSRVTVRCTASPGRPRESSAWTRRPRSSFCSSSRRSYCGSGSARRSARRSAGS